ncbi:hypothetical protein [Nonomuraea sp. SYSU D8015]|uniref:hypothetical protein n=1 Tax=Nonomuraea sp. SYSU D8015 TaxID=2593644 RepID=UPI001661300D|nr:hypothetical protein [Nonomuraea sp. SYSU D8015]
MNGTVDKLTPEALRRLQNLARTWNERTQAVKDDAQFAKLCFDRAKAAARRARRSQRNPRAMYELAELLATWAAQQEESEARWHGGHGS